MEGLEFPILCVLITIWISLKRIIWRLDQLIDPPKGAPDNG